MKKIFFATLLVILGILFRTVWHLGPNIEFVTASTILAAMYLGGSYAIAIPLLIMIISDIIIGNTNIYIFTWSAYIIIGFSTYLLNKLKTKNLILRLRSGQELKTITQNSKLFFGTKMGIISALFFYLWTNFGVWALDSWGMYSQDMSGLVRCYLMGLPFLRLNLIGNLLFIPASILLIEQTKLVLKKYSFKKTTDMLIRLCH